MTLYSAQFARAPRAACDFGGIWLAKMARLARGRESRECHAVIDRAQWCLRWSEERLAALFDR
jgi:hypothetical protein